MNIAILKKGAASLAIIAGVAGVTAVPAFAEPADLVVTGGTVSIPEVAVSDLTAVTLDGTAKSSTATMSAFSVTDSRGTGAGWHVSVQASPFAEWNGTAYVTGGKTIAAGSLSMTAPGVAANGTTSPAPTVGAGPFTIDNGAIKIASAALNQGMGKYDFTPGTSSMTLAVPASTYAKTYRSDVTVSVTSGP